MHDDQERGAVLLAPLDQMPHLLAHRVPVRHLDLTADECLERVEHADARTVPFQKIFQKLGSELNLVETRIAQGHRDDHLHVRSAFPELLLDDVLHSVLGREEHTADRIAVNACTVVTVKQWTDRLQQRSK